MAAGSAPPIDFGEAVAALVAAIAPGTRVDVVRRLSGGASQESWLIEGWCEDRPVELVMRRGQGGSGDKRYGAIGLPAEAALLRLAGAHGVPVPEVFRVLDPGDGLGTGFVMRRVHGETIARRILRDDRFAAIRPELARRSGEVLAGIGALPIADCPPLAAMPARAKLATMSAQYLGSGLRRPVLDYGFCWLKERLPVDPATLRLVHGDFRNGNLIIDEHGIAAVLDWELAHFGDPVEDLGWLCVPSWRFGEIAKPAGGFGSAADLIAGYTAAGGAPVDLSALHFWTVMGTLHWGLACIQFALDFRGGDRTVERGAIGRRLSETEIDLMILTRTRDGELL